jgi:hypothetical protein
MRVLQFSVPPKTPAEEHKLLRRYPSEVYIQLRFYVVPFGIRRATDN